MSTFGLFIRGRAIALLLAVVGLGWCAAGFAADVCPKQPGASTVFSTFCYDCLFPVRIGGVTIGDASNVPREATKQSICWCHHVMGIPVPGVTYGMWYPLRVVETVRTPYCSPTLGSSISSSASVAGAMKLGGGHQGPSNASGEYGGFMNMHVFAYPIGKIIGSMLSTACLDNTSGGADLAYVSELDPSWSNDELANVLTPESALFSNAAAIAACSVDAVAATASQPIGPMFWCMGSWGSTYPMDGLGTNKSVVQQNALIAGRAVAAMQRRGLIWKSMGDDALCHNYPNPIFTKGQYKLEQLWPVPELAMNHWIGASSMKWGEWRYTPVTGEDFVQLVFSWDDCCVW